MPRKKELQSILSKWRRYIFTKECIFWAVTVTIIIISFFLLYEFDYKKHLLTGDEPAFIPATLSQAPWGWFKEGFSHYFVVYPEWFRPYTNFLRPTSNLITFINHAVFGNQYGLYFITYFLFQFIGLYLFVSLLKKHNVAFWPRSFTALLFLFNPAYINTGLISLPFHFDIVAAVFLLGVLSAIYADRLTIAFILLTLSVFTKETAVFAPLAAALTVALRGHRIYKAATMLIPAIIWFSTRILAFGNIFQGTYATPKDPISILRGILSGLKRWPTGISYSADTSLKDALTSGEFGISHLFVIFNRVANIFLWFFIAWTIWKIIRQLLYNKAIRSNKMFISAASILIWVVGSLAVGVILSCDDPRFGASIYSFFLLFTAIVLFGNSAQYIPAPKWLSPVVLSILVVGTIYHSFIFVQNVTSSWTERELSVSLYDTLESLPQNGQPVFIVNAPQMFASPTYLDDGWKLNLNIVFINQFVGCTKIQADSTTPPSIKFEDIERTQKALAITLPNCAHFSFAGVEPAILTSSLRNGLERQGIGTYYFPESSSEGISEYQINLGKRLIVTISNAGTVADSIWIAYDWKSGRYYQLKSASQ